MQTEKIIVKNKGEGAAEALDMVIKFAGDLELDRKSSLRLRLLAEEALGMLKSITGDFEAEFWLENKIDKICIMHFIASAKMNFDKKKELLKTASDKKNSAAKGVMGRIREFIENGMYNLDSISGKVVNYGNRIFMYGSTGKVDMDNMALDSCVHVWSMEMYKKSLDHAKKDDEDAEEAWDELDKSIVANLADDIKVGVSGNKVELMIEKSF